jgi:hypothetical protein
MEGQSQKPTSGSSEGRLTTVANAISSAIDTDAVADSIFASLLKDGRSTKESGAKNPIQREQASPTVEAALMAEMSRVEKTLQKCLLEEARITNDQGAISSTMDEKIRLAVAAAVAKIEHTPSVDVRALREQTLGTFAFLSPLEARQLTEHEVNINVVYDIFNSRPDSKLSALKFITTRHRPYFSASIIRTQLDLTKSARPAIIIQADDYDSSDEAVEKLYKFSQSVLNHAWELSEDHEAYFDVWNYLFLHDSGDWWDKGCEIGRPLV